jgi:methylenetetrahydrofolate dehydrogenase (NADP+)/methenyltetrahydrofolate cyclohydrolase
MAKLIDGKTIAQGIRLEVADGVASLKRRGIEPRLVVVLVGNNPASETYVRNKGKACDSVGIRSETLAFPDTLPQHELLAVLDAQNRDSTVHGILVQLPLPGSIDEKRIISAVAPEKDVDGFHPLNVGALAAGQGEGFIPCTPAGVVELLIRSGFSPEGKHAVIVGRSNLVGKPLGLLLLRKAPGADATVTFCHSRTPNLKNLTRQGDLLVAAMGRPGAITGDMIKPGAVVVDVGINRIPDPSSPKGYRTVGDVCFEEAAAVASAITPVPGGVGPMTIAMLLKNTLKAAQSISKE